MNAPRGENPQIDGSDHLPPAVGRQDKVVARLAAQNCIKACMKAIGLDPTDAPIGCKPVCGSPSRLLGRGSAAGLSPVKPGKAGLMRLAEACCGCPDHGSGPLLLSDQLKRKPTSSPAPACKPPPPAQEASARACYLASQIMQGDQSRFLQRLEPANNGVNHPRRRRWGNPVRFGQSIGKRPTWP